MLNCIDFMKIEEKSIMQMQISMHLAQELLSYFELRDYESRAPNRATVCFYKKFWFKKKFLKPRSKLAEVGGNWSKIGF